MAMANLANMSALMDMANLSDVSPEALRKIFNDIGASPEKLRAVLNLWFVPQFRPTFVQDHGHTSGRDVDFFSTAEAPPTQLPYRMFDVETGNLVDFPAIGPRGQYCMLSHRWKGVELLLGDIKRARAEDLQRTQETIRAARQAGPSASAAATPRNNDVQLVLDQCKLDIQSQEQLIQELWSIDNPSELFCLGPLLDRRLRVKAAENRLEWAKNSEHATRSKLRVAEMEAGLELFQDLAAKGGVVEKVRAEVTKAEVELAAAEEEYQKALVDIDFFKMHNRVRDAIDEMICRLQRWKSAVKLHRVIQRASDIFRSKLFQRRERCYLWTDTCCIDKTNAGELSESLSLMGDWYAAAEFCLVQLDTDSSEADAAIDWRLFQAERGDQDPPPEFTKTPRRTITHFEDIAAAHPEWSTRAWTLQELVMSKTTFYLSPEYTPLSRPAESLGYFYHLMPFIDLYTRRNSDTGHSPQLPNLGQLIQDHADLDVASTLREIEICTESRHTSPPEQGSIEDKAKDEAARVGRAQHIITVLECLGVRLPKDVSMETATSEVARAVYLAAADLVGEAEDSMKRGIFQALCPEVGGDRQEVERQATQLINHLLRLLVENTLDLILEDRRYVAQFGLVEQLGSWQEGKRRTGFSAQSVLAVSGQRRATVATDRAYALMGILGVRFPTFSAEGYPMALARLLDQVVITHNDVSVFNWTGADLGSPVRGRSLYPSTHVAFSNHEDRGRQYNQLLLSQVQHKMDDVMQTYHQVISVLRRTIDTVKDKQQRDLPLGWIDKIVQLMDRSSFHSLRDELGNVRRIIGYIVKHCVREPPPPPPPTQVDSEKSKFSFPSLPSPSLSLPSPSLSLPSPSLPSLSGFGLGKKDDSKTSRFSPFGKKSSGKAEPATPVPALTPAPTETPTPTPASLPSNQNPTPTPNWSTLDPAVTAHLTHLTNSSTGSPPPLPSEILTIDPATLDPLPPSSSPIHTHMPDAQSTICPNPITITTSGITGLFDIQRVLVTMLDHPSLRSRVTRAVTPRDRIGGWCSISTGFSRVVASFCCEAGVLAQQLDAVEGIEARVLRQQEGERGRGIMLGMKTATGLSGTGMSGGEGEGEADGETEEERRVSRVIEFIQEAKLGLVAGEW